MPKSRIVPLVAACVFLSSAILIFFLTADLFHPSLDEGIYLEGGRRVLMGQQPYRDFFAYTGPLIYWVQAALERVFGPDLRMLRLSTVLSVGFICSGTFWMASRFVGIRVAVGTSIVFLGMLMPSFQLFAVNHRWLSISLMTLAAAAALNGMWLLAGALAAGAACATPSYLVPLAVLVVWASIRETRRDLALTAAGILAMALPVALWLAGHGALEPMFDKLVWASTQYSAANAVPYGFYALGFGASQTPRLLLPVVLIPVALALGLFEIRRGRWTDARALLVLLALGMFLTTWPRWDVTHLVGIMPPIYVLLAIWCEERMRDSGRLARPAILAVYTLALSAAFLYGAQLVSIVSGFTYFPTRMGLLRNIPEDGDAYATLEDRVPEGASVFIFPYMPSMGYMLKTRNPSSYSYLQPGMMSRQDEAAVLRELEANPPEFILRQYFPDDQVLQVWPNSDRSTMRFQSIEDFIDKRYSEVDKVRSPQFAMTVLQRRAR